MQCTNHLKAATVNFSHYTRRQRLSPCMQMNDGFSWIEIFQYLTNLFCGIGIPNAENCRPDPRRIGEQFVPIKIYNLYLPLVDADVDERYAKYKNSF